MDIDLIQMFWQAGDVEFFEEAPQRMDEREITIENIEQAILSGRIVEERLRSRPHARCTAQGWASHKVADWTSASIRKRFEPLEIAYDPVGGIN